MQMQKSFRSKTPFTVRCKNSGGSMAMHQAVKPAVPGSNPASLQPAGTCHFLLGSQQGWHDNCRLAYAEKNCSTNPKQCNLAAQPEENFPCKYEFSTMAGAKKTNKY